MILPPPCSTVGGMFPKCFLTISTNFFSSKEGGPGQMVKMLEVNFKWSNLHTFYLDILLWLKRLSIKTGGSFCCNNNKSKQTLVSPLTGGRAHSDPNRSNRPKIQENTEKMFTIKACGICGWQFEDIKVTDFAIILQGRHEVKGKLHNAAAEPREFTFTQHSLSITN